MPRLARATASASFKVIGDHCLQPSTYLTRDSHVEDTPLVPGLSLKLLVDGVEEASSSTNFIHVFLVSLDIGQHVLEAR